MKERFDRRAWLARFGITALGGGLLVGLTGGRQLGLVTSRARVRDVDAAQTGGTDETQTLRVHGGFVSAFIVTRGARACVIDSLTPGNADAIEQVLRGVGLDWSVVTDLILTHHHTDHSGSAAAVMERASGAQVWTGEADIPRIQTPRPISVAHDGMEIRGLQVIATPGHTEGHISLLDPATGALFTGDAAFNLDGISTASARNSSDVQQAIASFKRLSEIAFECVWFAHGEPLESGGQAAFQQVAATL